MKWIKNVALIVIFILFATAMASYVFQNNLIFQSEKLPPEHHFVFNQPYEEYFITTPDNCSLNALWFKPPQPAKGLVIYFHGNADHLQRWGHFASDFTKLGYEVIMMDYRSYGKSSGTPSEKLMYADARVVWNWVKERSVQNNVVIYGRSLGSAIATHLATEVNPALLILETPFDELMGASILKYLYALIPLHSKFATKDFIQEVSCKIVIFQGSNDWVVSLESAERLKPLLKESDEFVVIPQGGHYDLNEFELYHAKLADVLQ
jgi:alpha-beta hydrolase superfamily lysophospholipase